MFANLQNLVYDRRLAFSFFFRRQQMLADFLKKNIYLHWDVYHAFFILIILFIVLRVKG